MTLEPLPTTGANMRVFYDQRKCRRCGAVMFAGPLVVASTLAGAVSRRIECMSCGALVGLRFLSSEMT